MTNASWASPSVRKDLAEWAKDIAAEAKEHEKRWTKGETTLPYEPHLVRSNLVHIQRLAENIARNVG